MFSRLLTALLALLLVGALSACALPAPAATPTAEPSATAAPSPTAPPTAPPTSTAAPTETPEPTEEPTEAPTEEPTEEPEETEADGDTGEVVLTDELYSNARFGLTWDQPGDEWVFAPFDEAAVSAMGSLVAPLVTLQSVDEDERAVSLSVLDMGGPAFAQAMAAELEANPDETVELIASQLGLPADDVELSEVAGQPAISAPIEDAAGTTSHLWIIIAPQGLVYAVAAGFEDHAEAGALLETLTLEEVVA
ncbi:MAG TPA: hypothetical protein VF707_02120, partial [Ardenticatenaceae bacterium]